MAKPRSQPERRRSFNNKDQFGRDWLVCIEVDTGHPTGTINPCFPDDFQTPQKYLSVPDEAPRTIKIDIDAWVFDLKEAESDYRLQFDVTGMQLYGDGYKSDEMWANPRPNHLNIMGPAPRAWKEVEEHHKALLGEPAPRELVGAGSASESRISWLGRKHEPEEKTEVEQTE